MILDKIVETKKQQLKDEMDKLPLEALKKKLSVKENHSIINFEKALKIEKGLAIIGEVKKASPSKGIIKEDFSPTLLAKDYIDSGINAISVLTEKHYFQGNDEYLEKIRDFSPIPLLRKDFIIDIWQIYQARLIGADAILLIAAILTTEEIANFLDVAESLGLHCLVEVHDKEELERVLQTKAKIIGINNRNLQTFHVTLDTTEDLMKYIPKDKIIVSESGIETRADMERLENLGVNAVLIGESFMRAAYISEKVKELRSQHFYS